jgi:restriction system protein
MPIPTYKDIMLHVLRFGAGGETTIPVVADRIAAALGLTEAERMELLPSGGETVLRNRAHWARFYLGKAGLVMSPARGRFLTTDAGKQLLQTNPSSITIDILRQYPSFKEFYDTKGAAAPSAGNSAVAAATEDTATPEEQIDAARTLLHAALKAELLQRILEQSPAFFEQAITRLLVAMGYGGSQEDAARHLGRSGDGGVDGVINADRLGLDRIYVQAKRYASGNTIGRPDVQAFVGSLAGHHAGKGVFVTTSSFSTQAMDYVRHLPQRVILIDGDRFADLMIEHGVGVRVSRTVEVKRIDEDFFLEE